MSSMLTSRKVASLSVLHLLLMTSVGWTADQNSVSFRTPSGNIHCMIFSAEEKSEPQGLACDINQAFTRTPIRPKPAGCEFDWGQRFELGNDSDAGLECASDSVGSES